MTRKQGTPGDMKKSSSCVNFPPAIFHLENLCVMASPSERDLPLVLDLLEE
jgi:hypothetical protein